MSAPTETEIKTGTESMEAAPESSLQPVSRITNHGPVDAAESGPSNPRNTANVTELSEYRDRVTELEQERDKLTAEVLRHCVAADKGVPANLLTGVTQEQFEAAAVALIAFKEKPSGPIVPADGTASARNDWDSDWLRRELSKK